jgi:hypothetical protein
MSDSKRQKIDPSSLEFTVSIRGQGVVDGVSLVQFIDCDRVAAAIEEHLAKKPPVANQQNSSALNEQESRVLKLAQTVFPQAICVAWEEDGEIEDVGFSQYYEGSRYDLANEFDLEYSLDIYIGFSTPGDLKCEENDSGVWLRVWYFLSTETTDEKVYFEFKERFLDFTITNWQTDAVNPTPTQVRELLLSIVDQEVANPMKKYINEQINELNMDTEMKMCPRFLSE